MQDNWFSSVPVKKERVKNLFSYLGLFIASATVLIFSALFFTDISFSFASTVDFSLSFFLLFFSSYVIYISLFETGRTQGERDERFAALHEKRETLFALFRTQGTQESLRNFCKTVSERETTAQREELLRMHFLTEEELSALASKKKSALSRKERCALAALQKQKPVSVTPRALLAERPLYASHAPLSLSPDTQKRRRVFHFLLPLALFAALSVSVACEILLAPSADAVVGYLLKLFTLLQSAVKGFRAGYLHITVDKTEYLTEQCALLEEYLKLCPAQK